MARNMGKLTTYSAEFKEGACKEFEQSDLGIKSFAKSINVPHQTFYSWVQKYRKGISNNNNSLIDVKDRTMTILDNETNNKYDVILDNTFVMKINDISMSFNINNLKDVLKVIIND